MKMKAEIGVTILSAKEQQRSTRSCGRGMDQILPHSPEGTDPADTFVLDFHLPEPWDNTFLTLKPPSLQYVVTAALGYKCTWHCQTWGTMGRELAGRARQQVLGASSSTAALQRRGLDGWHSSPHSLDVPPATTQDCFFPKHSPTPLAITALRGSSDGRETEGARTLGHIRTGDTWQPTPFKFNQRLEDRKLQALIPRGMIY